ncbi:hypothetical protein [Kitasatospora sp. NPDC001527]|uniref:hypothetical protein n=1 Tax=Kitasatospora sp. NPDC001527 TaxID=3154519 RepID=UPI0033230BFB
MAQHDDDDDVWADEALDASREDEVEGGRTPKNPEEKPLETLLVEKLDKMGFGLLGIMNSSLAFKANSKWGGRLSLEVHLPKEYCEVLSTQLRGKVESCTSLAGIVIPEQGYIEVLVRPNQASSMPTTFLVRRLSVLSSDSDVDCPNGCSEAGFPSLRLYRIQQGSEEVQIRLHGKDACLQISGPSPACHILSNYGYRESPRHVLSIRAIFGKKMSRTEIEESFEPLLNSLLYELDVRNHVILRPVKWRSRAERRRSSITRDPVKTVRYPEIRVNPETSVLFGFAGSATGNPPLAFLSYYQILESFFPLAGRRSALNLLKVELSDPLFDRRQDRHLMRLLAVGESAAAASESAQLKVLIDEFVRPGKLREFFEDDWEKHFTKVGPIKGISENINLENRQTPLASQVAERVYRIRNRIVHAKDDPKYDSVPALLPQSDEAESLWPDIELVRLLAYEVILSIQTRGG